MSVPDGYKVDYTAKQEKQSITEMVPKAESVKDWTEMVTVQIFYGQKATTQQFKARLATLWSQACPGGVSLHVTEAIENGYPALVWLQMCPNNPQTAKPEWTWVKALAGHDSLYVVQKAFRFEPSKEQVVQWTKYLRGVAVCDSRIKERSCPAALRTQ